ncbi:DNA primase [Arenicella xantha]|uniref:DNA primase n=1 Tax=Arenicella xantha TaxID=644221 RepID=A0A395JJ92_9GAMM|nr:DNA primase [Arenicella xantha]RBP48744.1 DNA primase [Arenicella xantha]
MAGRIPQHFIDQLLNRIDVVDLIDAYVPLKKAGANYKACCPFHGEKTPSFTVSPSKQFYHCFGCGANGTAISFLMEYDHMEFRDAIEKLASSAGMEIPEEAQGFTPKNTSVAGVDLYQLMEQVNEFYQTQLRQHKDRDQAVSYLKARGLSGDIAKRFGLGFAPEGWDNLMSQLGSTVSTQKALLDTGMLTENEKKRVYDRFRHRIMFPIHDHRGRIVGFGGRVLESENPQPGNPKYLNSPETPIFHKGSELYGLYAARGGIKDADGVLVVEGYMDVVALAQAGINNAVATLGTATTPMHLQRLFRHTPNITFCFDGDRAGREAAWKALETSLSALQDGFQVSFLFLPDGEDPDTMVKKIGKDAFQALITDAKPLPDFLIENLQTQADVNRLDGRAKLSKLARPLIDKLPNGVLKKLILDRLASITQVSVQDLASQETMNEAEPAQRPNNRQPQAKSDHTGYITPVRRALSLILQYPHLHPEFAALGGIPDDQMRGIGIIQSLYAACVENPNASTATLLERYRQESFFATLSQLANHQHNNMEHLEEDDAKQLINGTICKVIEEYNANEIIRATNELEALSKRARASALSQEDEQRRQTLMNFLRESYK